MKKLKIIIKKINSIFIFWGFVVKICEILIIINNIGPVTEIKTEDMGTTNNLKISIQPPSKKIAMIPSSVIY